jgi:hypothetical protein
VYLKIGVPIFYNSDVYQERLKERIDTNIYEYSYHDSNDIIIRKFTQCLRDLVTKQNKSYINVDDVITYDIPDFYKNILLNTK